MQTNTQANFNHVSPSIFAKLAVMAEADGIDLEEYHEQILARWIQYPTKLSETSPNFEPSQSNLNLNFDELIRTLFIEINKNEFYTKLKIEIIKTHNKLFFARVFEENFYQLRPSFSEKNGFAKDILADEQLFVPIDYWTDDEKHPSEQLCIDSILSKINDKFYLS